MLLKPLGICGKREQLVPPSLSSIGCFFKRRLGDGGEVYVSPFLSGCLSGTLLSQWEEAKLSPPSSEMEPAY